MGDITQCENSHVWRELADEKQVNSIQGVQMCFLRLFQFSLWIGTPKSEVTYVDVYTKYKGPETWITVEEDKHFMIQIMLLPQFIVSKEIAIQLSLFNSQLPSKE